MRRFGNDFLEWQNHGWNNCHFFLTSDDTKIRSQKWNPIIYSYLIIALLKLSKISSHRRKSAHNTRIENQTRIRLGAFLPQRNWLCLSNRYMLLFKPMIQIILILTTNVSAIFTEYSIQDKDSSNVIFYWFFWFGVYIAWKSLSTFSRNVKPK